MGYGRVRHSNLGVRFRIVFRVDVRIMVRVSKLLGSDYGHGKFNVIVSVRVRLGLGCRCSSTLTTY